MLIVYNIIAGQLFNVGINNIRATRISHNGLRYPRFGCRRCFRRWTEKGPVDWLVKKFFRVLCLVTGFREQLLDNQWSLPAKTPSSMPRKETHKVPDSFSLCIYRKPISLHWTQIAHFWSLTPPINDITSKLLFQIWALTTRLPLQSPRVPV